ncbi:MULTISPECIES: plasmid mobilization protein [Erysipelotrichaceae]|mgnify:CR=1 FL=1|uniref:plasmid mobilization protein n=1 Tax=Erysipelotrichaceae TaxID=128827 RepID=UPI002490A5F6|nr:MULTISPECIES: plasmid mobilization relaxosome protein MobC [Erysipelotrichaceae]
MKDKRIEIRVSSDLYYTIISYARSLGISVTQLIVESVLASEVVQIQEISDIEMERVMCMKKIGDNINQVARAMNSIYKNLQQTTDTDLLIANADFKSLLMEVRDIKHEFFSCIEAERMNKEEFYSFLVTRNIHPELEKYLQENDPIYLKQLKNRENGT